MCAANTPEIRLELLGCDFGVKRPVEPRKHCFDVAGFNRGTAPDAKTRRRIAVSTNVQRDALTLKPFGNRFGKRRAVSDTGVREFQTDGCVRPSRLVHRQIVDPVPRGTEIPDRIGVGICAHPQRRQTADDFAQFSAKR